MAKDPKLGTGKKPKGSGRRLYTDENPKDSVPIKFGTVKEAEATVRRVRRSGKSFARKIQILHFLIIPNTRLTSSDRFGKLRNTDAVGRNYS